MAIVESKSPPWTTVMLVVGMGVLFFMDYMSFVSPFHPSHLLRTEGASGTPQLRTPLSALPTLVPEPLYVPGATLPGSEEVSFNVIITTTGRYTLPVFFDSLTPQLTDKDYITLISDKADWHVHVAQVFSHVRCNCTKLLIENANSLGWWGHGSRNKWQRSLPGAFHLHADDDDLYTPDAFAKIRAVVVDLAPRLYIFRLIRRWDGEIGLIPPMSVTRGEQIKPGAVSTQNGVIRAVPGLYRDWPYLYGGDGHFYEALVATFGAENVTIVPEVIYHFG